MIQRGYLVVEGPHDIEFVCKLLAPFGLRRIRFKQDVPTAFQALIPTAFPHQDDLLKRMPLPLFLKSDTLELAIDNAIGDTRLVETLEETLALVDTSRLNSIGLVFDADTNMSASVRYASIRTKLLDLGLNAPTEPGLIADGQTKIGAFVMPDNATSGTLEDLLLACGQENYPQLLASAQSHVAGLESFSLNNADRKDISKPAGKNKAIVAAMAAILRPGKAVQVSIQDNRWLEGGALALPRIKAVQDFFVALLGLESKIP